MSPASKVWHSSFSSLSRLQIGDTGGELHKNTSTQTLNAGCQELAKADYLCGAAFWRVIDTIGLHDTNLTEKEAEIFLSVVMLARCSGRLVSAGNPKVVMMCHDRFWTAFPLSLKQLQKAKESGACDLFKILPHHGLLFEIARLVRVGHGPCFCRY